VQKWGNSLGLRIPKPFAEETRLEENVEVEMSVRAGKLIVEAVEPALTLEVLLDQITDENLHDEISTGQRVGKETW
ncbi:MAG TPA: AbrB/MazE/SpoVT family DNA-binding domain-containing protein, partial [Thermoanaerobaculia bacterium]|nr:AbrB/MazE/SpoVT family DNA-binding domain-containing protein [Thermoanaerobaculia bacterium]